MKSRLAEILKSKAFIAIALNVLFALFCVFCLVIKFEESDDFYLGAMLSGAFSGEPSGKILFVNVILGSVLKFLYGAFPALNWFVIIPIIAACAASVLFCYALMDRLGRMFGLAASLVFLCFFTEDLYVMYQWTKAAAYLCGTGLFIVVWALAQKRSWMFIAGGIALCVLGTWIRRESLFLVLPFILALFLCAAAWRGNVRKTVFALCCLCACIFAGDKIQNYANAAPEFRAYAEYNGDRARIMDYARGNQTDFNAAAEKSGLDGRDLALMQKWIFLDPSVFSLQTMRNLSGALVLHPDSWWTRIHRVAASSRARWVVGYPMFLALLLLSIGVFFTNRPAMKWVLLFWLLTLALYCYFICKGRLLYRLEFGLWFGAAIGVLWQLRPNKIWCLRWNCSLLLAIALFQMPTYFPLLEIGRPERLGCTEDDRLSLNALFFTRDYQEGRYSLAPQKHGCYAELKQEFDSHPENIYMFAGLDIIRPQYAWFGTLRAVPAGYFERQVHLGTWWYPWPPHVNALKNVGIENPIKQIVDSNVYVVAAEESGNISELAKYLKKHYYINVSAARIKEVDGFGVYKFEALE